MTFYINGPSLVYVKGVNALATLGPADEIRPWRHELGITAGPIRIIPNFVHHDINVDDFGPDIPADCHAMIADVSIHMILVHYDEEVLQKCFANSLGYPTVGGFAEIERPGTLAGAGVSLGRGKQIFEPGNSFISLSLTAGGPQPGDNVQTTPPWRFPACYIPANPTEIPIGSDRTLLVLRWRAIPYKPLFKPYSNKPLLSTIDTQELTSKGVRLWYRTIDDPNPEP